MRIESRVLSLSWIPSETVSGVGRLPFVVGLGGHDAPPPERVGDHRALVGDGRVRQANELRAWVEFDEGGRPARWDYAAPPERDALSLPTLRPDPEARERSVRFQQTAGGPLGAPVPRRVLGRPFFRVDTPIAWTTLALTIDADGTARGELVGASPYPRHWLYDADGKLLAKSGEADFRRWLEGAHGSGTPWGGEDSPELTVAAESALERQLSARIMGARPSVRRVRAGEMLIEQGSADDTVFLVLDGVLDVEIAGQTVAEVGPGAIVGERAAIEGRRSATLRARTDARVVPVAPESLSAEERAELAAMHRREES